MNQSSLEALLGRSLSTREVTNLKLYLDIAKSSLENLLCISLCDDDDSDSRTYPLRKGYCTVFTDIFTEITSVKVDGITVSADDYHVAQWDSRSGKWFNSIVFNSAPSGETVEVEADWGFEQLPSDLQMLLAQLFANTSKKYSGTNVKSKKIEDFAITYGDLTDDEVFMNANTRTIRKYSMCDTGFIRHGGC